MATRKPLIVNPSAEQIQELPSGDSLDGITNVTASGTVQAEQITSTDDINATGTVTAEQITSTDDMSATGTVTAADFVGNGTIPLGGIVMWSGNASSTSVPTGWTLCDGNSGSAVNGITIPNLVDKFIIGAKEVDSSTWKSNVTGSLTANGGSKDAVVVQHTHKPKAATASATVANGTSVWVDDNQIGNYGSGSGSGGGPIGNREFLDNPAGSVAGTDKNLPPYFSLAYIIRTS